MVANPQLLPIQFFTSFLKAWAGRKTPTQDDLIYCTSASNRQTAPTWLRFDHHHGSYFRIAYDLVNGIASLNSVYHTRWIWVSQRAKLQSYYTVHVRSFLNEFILENSERGFTLRTVLFLTFVRMNLQTAISIGRSPYIQKRSAIDIPVK